ncbi:amidohydrolase family protein [bacterium]|nr:amidohydrolase family protein [bacterium]
MTKRILNLVALLALVLSGAASAHDYVPGAPQSQPILLKGGDLYTVAAGVLPHTDLLFENGRITQIGPDIIPPENTNVIDISGKRVYPGLIDMATTLGLIEIGEVRATNDQTEQGRVTPEVTAATAYNPDSELLPTVRSNGITTVLVYPGGSLIQGRSSLMNLDGWTREDAAEKPVAALHVTWPRTRIVTAWWMQQSPEEQKKENAKNRDELSKAFEDAHAYYIAKKADPSIPVDLRWEAMLPVFDRELPVIIYANDYRQIEQAIAFGRKWNLRFIIAGATEAFRALDLLKEHNVPVIVRRVLDLPPGQDDPYDAAFTLPHLLHEAGVPFAIATYSSWASRNLPFHAGMAVAFGLSKEEGLRSITLTPAEMLGVDGEIGSLEVGKKATLVVAAGDILDMMSHRVEMMFIEGKSVDLNDRHKELYEKYQRKHWSEDK